MLRTNRSPIAIAALVFFFSQFAFGFVLSKNEVPYYGSEFYQKIARGERDEALIESLRAVLTGLHVERQGQLDEISNHCPSGARCYRHMPVGYDEARRKLLGEIHLVQTGGEYGVLDVYCEKTFVKTDFKSGGPVPGPNTIPEGRIVNTEHTWPQSRFNPRERATQKCDMHHLFPTDNQMNSTRGNLQFAEVDNPREILKCPISKLGRVGTERAEFFEPPDRHKGNVARALFYFSVRYSLRIGPVEEAFLKKWNRQDPVDTFERERNGRIQQIQGNRNPFVDHSELADAIADF